MKITTAKNIHRDIDPTKITILRNAPPKGPNKDAGPTLFIVGLTKKAIKVSAHVETFLASLPNKDSFVKLAFAKGMGFWVNAPHVLAIRQVDDSDLVSHPLAQSVITIPAGERFLSTDFNIAKGLINAAGGKV